MARERQQRALQLKRRHLLAEIKALEAQLAGVEEDAAMTTTEEAQHRAAIANEMSGMSPIRGAG